MVLRRKTHGLRHAPDPLDPFLAIGSGVIECRTGPPYPTLESSALGLWALSAVIVLYQLFAKLSIWYLMAMLQFRDLRHRFLLALVGFWESRHGFLMGRFAFRLLTVCRLPPILRLPNDACWFYLIKVLHSNHNDWLRVSMKQVQKHFKSLHAGHRVCVACAVNAVRCVFGFLSNFLGKCQQKANIGTNSHASELDEKENLEGLDKKNVALYETRPPRK